MLFRTSTNLHFFLFFMIEECLFLALILSEGYYNWFVRHFEYILLTTYLLF